MPSKYNEAYQQSTYGTNAEKQQLYDFVKEIFQVKEIPDLWIEQIHRECTNDKRKTYYKLYLTLRYATKIMGEIPDPDYGVKGIITRYYDMAAKYYNNLHRVLVNNQKIDIVNEIQTVSIPRPQSKSTFNLTKIEDL